MLNGDYQVPLGVLGNLSVTLILLLSFSESTSLSFKKSIVLVSRTFLGKENLTKCERHFYLKIEYNSC